MSEATSLSAADGGLSAEIHPLQAVLRFLRAVRYRKGVVIITVALSALLAGLYYATTPRIYESAASLLVLQLGVDNWSAGMDQDRRFSNMMATHEKMLSSDAVLEEAVKLLPEEQRDDLNGVAPGDWPDVIHNNLEVSAVRNTNILEVGYRSHDPGAAAAVVGAVLSAYLTFTDDLHKSTAQELLEILTNEKTKLEAELRSKEEELIALRRTAGDGVIRDGDQGINVVVKRAIALNEALIAAHEKRLEAQSQQVAIEAAIRRGDDLQQHALAMLDDVGRELLMQRLGISRADVLTVSRISQQLLEDRSRLQIELQQYGPAHRKVREVQERIAMAEQFLNRRGQMVETHVLSIGNAELAGLLREVVGQRLQQAMTHEKAVHESYQKEKDLAIGLDHTMASLEMLDLDLGRLRGFYDVVVQRVKDIHLRQENGMFKTAVLDRPEVPNRPVWPRKSTIALIALALGLAAGLAIVYLQDLLDDHFRSPEELRMQLGLPVLAMVRRMPLEAEEGAEAIYAHSNPNAAECEAFRTLRTALALAEGGVGRIVVSSSEPGDGKTTVTSNLAVAYAQSGKRTLLIDADLRRPGLTPLLGLKGERGLSTVLRDGRPVGASAETNVVRSLVANLDVLPSGPRPGHPTELLAADRFSELLGWAEARYDQIVIDSPPALVSDTAIIGRLVDGVLLTVMPEKNRRRVVIRAAESFSALGIRLLGIVVNCLAEDKAENYYGYSYGYGYTYGYEADPENEGDEPAPLMQPSPRAVYERAA
jgi:polysaccharide biosynthesis transport protein